MVLVIISSTDNFFTSRAQEDGVFKLGSVASFHIT